jgi:hypothetical protein
MGQPQHTPPGDIVIRGLNSWELESLIGLCERHWKPEDRQRIAKHLPQVYAKLTGTRVEVDTKAEWAKVSVDPES